MKRYNKCQNKKKLPSTMRNPFYYKEQRAKLKNNAGSTFMRVSLFRKQSEEQLIRKDLLAYGIISYKQPKQDEYMVEFDNHQNSTPHFHVWRTNGYSKISDTRSQGISLKSGINTGLEFTYKERKKEPKLNDIQSEEILTFVLENRFLLYCMYHAFRSGKIKDFVGLDEERVYSLFSKSEMASLKQKYTLELKQTDYPEFSK